ncbi:MAG: hypothetical protein QN152_04830 [Armatimonadota bacterium]|nr:hypothetical protein [Armatimonadota bacterium]MDR7470965.1 hypothetical protein [Armatimonadota bacterium]MDR7538841.1 hypothetical protein [Armatimonadota bacterium]
MDRLVTLVRRYPVASLAVLVAVVAGVLLFRPSRPSAPRGVVQPRPALSPAPAVSPVPAPRMPAAEVSPAPAATPAPPPPQAAGRPDPFVPLVTAQVARAPAAPRPVSLPPPAPLPPPLFPGPPTPVAPAPAAPAPAPAPEVTPPPPPPRMAEAAELIGVLGDSGRVAIIRIAGQVYIVAQGEMIQNTIRVELVDAREGLVVLVEDGQRFEVRFG